jgi:aspartate/methionine/tyrosine aminotransferase
MPYFTVQIIAKVGKNLLILPLCSCAIGACLSNSEKFYQRLYEKQVVCILPVKMMNIKKVNFRIIYFKRTNLLLLEKKLKTGLSLFT